MSLDQLSFFDSKESEKLEELESQIEELPQVEAIEGRAEKSNGEQATLFDLDELQEYKKEWRDMPEFIQEDLTSEFEIIVHFKNREDMAAFSKLIEQTITGLTRSIWYPKAEIDRYINKLFIDESQDSNES